MHIVLWEYTYRCTSLRCLQKIIYRIPKFDGSRTYCTLRSEIVKFYGEFNSDNVSMSSKFGVQIINAE